MCFLDILRVKTGLEPKSHPLFLEGKTQDPGVLWTTRYYMVWWKENNFQGRGTGSLNSSSAATTS